MRSASKVLQILIAVLIFPALAPAEEDATRLIKRHFQARGDSQRVEPFQVLVRKGTFAEGRFQCDLTWARRHQAGLHEERSWTHLGRQHREVRAYNGETTWSQAVAPENKRAAILTGELETQFRNEGWLLTDITFPLRQALKGDLKATYVDDRSIRDRAAAWVEIKSDDSIQMTYIFDLESGLILAIEMPHRFPGTEKRILALPVGITRVEGRMIESGFDFYVDGQKFRSIRFEENSANLSRLELTFDPPHSKEIWLR